jgi:hypothetical protein
MASQFVSTAITRRYLQRPPTAGTTSSSENAANAIHFWLTKAARVRTITIKMHPMQSDPSEHRETSSSKSQAAKLRSAAMTRRHLERIIVSIQRYQDRLRPGCSDGSHRAMTSLTNISPASPEQPRIRSILLIQWGLFVHLPLSHRGYIQDISCRRDRPAHTVKRFQIPPDHRPSSACWIFWLCTTPPRP